MPWCSKVKWKLTGVVSWPPCCDAVQVKTLPTLPIRAPCPQPARLIDEVSHLSGHIAEAGRSAEDDRVGLRQLRWICDRHVGEGRAGPGCAALFQHLVGDESRHLPQARLGTGIAGPGSDRLRHQIDMSIHAVNDDLNFRWVQALPFAGNL